MDNPDVVILGSGISGLAFAWKAARSGRRCLVLEKRDRIGGCIYSCRFEDGFWYELGAHTVYNSYSGMLEIVEEAGLADRLVQRGPARVHFGLLKDGTIDWLTPPRILQRLSWLEVALHAPIGFFRKKRNRTLQQHYAGLLGPRNFSRILSPFLAAVPSQCADDFPAEGPGSLFKKRTRRKEYPRSFGFEGGLQSLCDAIVRNPNITVRKECAATELAPCADGFEIRTGQGDVIRAPQAAVALPHGAAALLLRKHYPRVSEAVEKIASSSVESLGARIPLEKCRLPACAFIVPVEGRYFSAVTRDPFPDPAWRAFAFHFRPGTTTEQKSQCMCDLLQATPDDLEVAAGQQLELPAPRAGHREIIAEIDGTLAGTGIALLGNYFSGLAIEDCISRAADEWKRLTTV